MSNVDWENYMGSSPTNTSASSLDVVNDSLLLERIRALLDPDNYPEAYKSARATRNTLIIASYTLIVFVSLFGNLSVCFVVLKRRRMRSSTNCLMTNLAVSDLLMTVINIPFNIARILLNQWPFGTILCVVVPLVQVTSVYVSTITMTVIAIDRYLAIIHPLDKRISTHVPIKLIILIIWLISAVFSAPTVMFNEVVEMINVRRCRAVYPEPTIFYVRLITLLTFLSQYLLPLSVTTFAYVRISRYIWHKLNYTSNEQSNGTSNYSMGGDTHCCDEQSSTCQVSTKTKSIITNDNHLRQHSSNFNISRMHERSRRKSIKMLAIVVAVFAICWLPLNIYHLSADFGSRVISQNIFWICHWCAMSSVCYNPFIYFWLNRQYREEIKLMFTCYSKTAAHAFLEERGRLNAGIEMNNKHANHMRFTKRRDVDNANNSHSKPSSHHHHCHSQHTRV